MGILPRNRNRAIKTFKNHIMKELINQLSQYKSDINRELLNAGKTTHLGFIYCKGKTPSIYVADNNGLVLTSYSYKTGNDLLIAMVNVRLGLIMK